jgi:hypothetical protein
MLAFGLQELQSLKGLIEEAGAPAIAGERGRRADQDERQAERQADRAARDFERQSDRDEREREQIIKRSSEVVAWGRKNTRLYNEVRKHKYVLAGLQQKMGELPGHVHNDKNYMTRWAKVIDETRAELKAAETELAKHGDERPIELGAFGR